PGVKDGCASGQSRHNSVCAHGARAFANTRVPRRIGLQRWPACISSVARIERAIFVSVEDAARRWRVFESPTFATLEWPSLRSSTHYGKHLEDEHLKSTAAGGRARSIRAISDFCSRWGLPSGAVPPPRIM